MSIDTRNREHRSKLRRAVQYSFNQTRPHQARRKMLQDVYRGRSHLQMFGIDFEHTGTYVNLFREFVTGMRLTLATNNPTWEVSGRSAQSQTAAPTMEAFLKRMTEVINLRLLSEQWSIDAAFGNAYCKIGYGPAPRGVLSKFMPRAYRVRPDLMIYDLAADSFEQATWLGDTYLVPLNEAMQHPGFSDTKFALMPFQGTSNMPMAGSDLVYQNQDAYAEDQTRLVDLYIPSQGAIFTWPANGGDLFSEIEDLEPLQSVQTTINPYTAFVSTVDPESIEELSRLSELLELHLWANDMLEKSAFEARQSKRNPVTTSGEEDMLKALLQLPDGDGGFLNPQVPVNWFAVPGPDPSLFQSAHTAMNLFSRLSGNLEVALGQGAGAETARQTQALLGQITARQALDRQKYEVFLAEIGRKLLSLAFEDEALTMQFQETVPELGISLNRTWAPAKYIPRPAPIEEFHFEVVAGSTSMRTHAERVEQLVQASQLMTQFLQLKMQGAPLDMGVIAHDIAQAFDQVPRLLQWWSGEEPTAVQSAAQAYTSMAQKGNPSRILYEGAAQGAAPATDSFVNPTALGITGEGGQS